MDCFHGTIDEARLYCRALTDSEVSALASVQPASVTDAAPRSDPTPRRPMPGDVFHEYSWKTEKSHVLSLKEKPLELPGDIDLVAATRAEVVVEIANQHVGFEGRAIRLNGNQWCPLL